MSKEIVLGLKYISTTTRRGIRVDKDQVMIGSYPPAAEPVTFTFPEIQDVPSGMLARGTYKTTIRVTDDDKNDHGKVMYTFKIAKKWA